MASADYTCPNCGENVDLKDGKVMYCPYCAAKIEHESHEDVSAYIEKALDQMKQEMFEQCLESVNEGLAINPSSHDLNFLKAVITHDNQYLESVSSDKLSDAAKEAAINFLGSSKVNQACKLKQKQKSNKFLDKFPIISGFVFVIIAIPAFLIGTEGSQAFGFITFTLGVLLLLMFGRDRLKR